MKTLVVYDSVQGNTEKIAHAIGAAIGDDVQVQRPADVDLASLATIGLLIVGAPTHGGRPTAPIQEFLDKLPATAIKGKRFAAFDTRLPAKWVKPIQLCRAAHHKAVEQIGRTPYRIFRRVLRGRLQAPGAAGR